MIVGIDYSSYEAVLCGVPFEGGKPKLAHAVFRPKKASGEDAAIAALAAVAESVTHALREIRPSQLVTGGGDTIVAEVPEPCVLFVERGYGQSRRSDWVLGAFFAAIYVACGRFGPVNAMDIQEWKREVTKASGIGMTKDGTRGNGQAKKEVANEATRALLLLVEVDATDWTADELDAYGLAFAGRRANQRGADALERSRGT